jgi:hypothetical protein
MNPMRGDLRLVTLHVALKREFLMGISGSVDQWLATESPTWTGSSKTRVGNERTEETKWITPTGLSRMGGGPKSRLTTSGNG